MYTLADQHRLRPWPEKAVIFPEGSLLAPDPCARPSGELRVGLTLPHLLERKKSARCDSCEPSPPASATLLRGGLPAEAGCLILPRSAVSIPLSPTIEEKKHSLFDVSSLPGATWVQTVPQGQCFQGKNGSGGEQRGRSRSFVS